MLKQLNKQSQKQCLSLKLAQRNVTTRKLTQGMNVHDRAIKKVLDIQAQCRGGLGVVRLNREHRNNMLTPNFIQQVKRGVETMYIDHAVELIYLTTAQGQQFSNGTDFRTIMHYKANNESDKLVDYLGGIFDLQATFAKINKPIMSIAPGNSLNSGAGLLAASGLPYISFNSMLAFNEVQFGFVPHAGSSYYMSRLPGDFGTFLTLTGFPISGQDAIDLKLADGHVDHIRDHEFHMADVVYAMDSSNLLTAKQARGADSMMLNEDKQVQDTAINYKDTLQETNEAYVNELRRRNLDPLHQEKFVDPRHRKPDLVAEADVAYERILRSHSEANYGLDGTGYFEHGATNYNIFEDVYNHCERYAGDVYQKNPVKTLLQHRQMISRCFWPNTVEEIMENLKMETHPFAKEILLRIDNNSMLSMKIALKMLRRSKNMAYGEILKMELNASLNKINDSDFEKGVTNVLLTPPDKRVYPGYDRNVSEDQAESYLQENPLSSQVNLDIVENSLLPTRHFYKQFTDSLRVYINETSSPQERVREAVELEIKDVLRKEGVNILDKTMTIPLAREYIYKNIKKQNYNMEFINRSIQMVSDKQLRRNYYDKVSTELSKYELHKDQFYQLVNRNVSEIFEMAYIKKLQNVISKSDEAHGLQKRRMFIRLKKFLIKSRILQFHQHETEKMTKRIMNMPFKVPHMTEDFDKSFRETEHPMIKQSVMWHLSQVVGKQNLLPEVMLKTYLTNPEAAQQMTAYVFDKEGLQKLQRDLFENPEKYEQLLNQDNSIDPWEHGIDAGRFFEMKEEKQKNVDYKYSFFNDGRSRKNHLDNWRMETEYLYYKDWADKIKGKALDTLKMTVSRLLLDFEQNKNLNNIVNNFQKGKKDTKQASLRRLVTILNEQDEKVQINEKQKTRQQPKSHSVLHKEFNQLISEDANLSKLFAMDTKSLKDNTLINRFRKELLSDLQNLVEIVLLEKNSDFHGNVTQEILQERLKEFLKPQNKDKTAQLNFIDTFLQDKRGQRAIRKAIDIVKPYYLSMINKRIEEETHKLLQAFRYQENRNEALTHYLVFQKNPEMLDSKVLQKIDTHHPLRQALRAKDKLKPEESRIFKYKKLLGDLNVSQDIDSQAAVSVQENQLKQSTKLQMEQITHFNELDKIQEEMIDDAIKKKNQDELKGTIQNKEETDAFDSEDQAELQIIERTFELMEDQVLNLEHEFDTLFSSYDWLIVYKKAIKNQSLDMESLIQQTRSQELYSDDIKANSSQLNIINKKFNTKQSWENFGDYSGFLAGLVDAQVDLSKDQQTETNYTNMVQFLRLGSQPQESVDRDVLFKSVLDQGKDNRIQKNIESMKDINDRRQVNSETRYLIAQLTLNTPENVRKGITAILESDSQYINHQKILTYLKLGKFDTTDLNQSKFINLQALQQDIMQGNVLPDFLKNYGDTKLDVISLSELKSFMTESEKITNYQKSQISPFFINIEDQLSHISNQRRSDLTLSEFLGKHDYTTSTSMKTYSNDMLRNIIEGAIGQVAGAPTVSEDTVHPAAHLAKVKESVRDLAFDVKTGGQIEETSKGSAVQKEVFRQARRSIELSTEMKQVRNSFENQLLQAYSESNFDETRVQTIIQDYTQARINDCMLRPDFAKGLKTSNSEIYMRLLREGIIDELKLTDSMLYDDFGYHNNRLSGQYQQRIVMDKSAAYNLTHLNNDQAIGFNKLEERAANLDQNQNIAHDNVFDQMLADYFLQKRGEVKKSNSLIQDLSNKFTTDETPLNSSVKTQETRLDKTLGEHYARQTWDKEDKPTLEPYNLTTLMDLDIAVNRQLHNKKGFLSSQLRQLDNEQLEIPEYYQINDVRKPVDLYVKDKLRNIMNELFEARSKVEKYMSRHELLAYDEILQDYLKHKNLMPKLKREIYKDLNMFEQQNQIANHAADGQSSFHKQTMKKRNRQELINKGVVNEDAYYKFLAFAGSLEKKRRENRQQTLDDPEIYAGFDAFDQFYMETLTDEAKHKPREIDEEALKYKSPSQIASKGKHLDVRERAEKYIDDHQAYKEGKLDQHERIELFYILEQLNKQANEKNDIEKVQEASGHLKDYFSNPENTFFYEKNKIN